MRRSKVSRGARIHRIRAGRSSHFVLAGLVGLAAGTGGYTFVYGHGASYLTNNPAACANCHIMNAQYTGWLQASHRSVATCNDCHTPDGLVGKMTTKALNGFWHSFAFSTRRFPEPIRIKTRNLGITEVRCRGCHQDVVAVIETGWEARTVLCVRCHRSAGHRR